MRNEVVTVIVVDDHPFFRDGLTRGLENSGHIKVVGTAADGRNGVDALPLRLSHGFVFGAF
jgi:two-component system nitrate/nitrite response regulator NarL